ncbi:MAG: division/cell wall cluster transcriptional repressor MraZ [Saprospiraceae bacterium]|nr:division/cell wall cluster transcriptional repressor MraZ [Saprospiraceae bacterium]
MPKLLGEFECKLDAKGRLRVPSQLVRQFEMFGYKEFVLNRGLESCLDFYPQEEWDNISEEVDSLSDYVKKHRDYKRWFYRGASKMVLDGNDRILIPLRLQDYGLLKKDVILIAMKNKIEIWAKEVYDADLPIDPDAYTKLAEEVMGDRLRRGMPNTDSPQGPR